MKETKEHKHTYKRCIKLYNCIKKSINDIILKDQADFNSKMKNVIE